MAINIIYKRTQEKYLYLDLELQHFIHQPKTTIKVINSYHNIE